MDVEIIFQLLDFLKDFIDEKSAYDKLYIMELDIIKEIVQDIENKGLKLEIIETEDDIQLVLAQ